MTHVPRLRRVAVTGIGLVTPLGVGWRRSWQNLLAGKSGLTSLKSDRAALAPSATAVGLPTEANPARAHARLFDGLPSTVAGLVPYGAYQEGGFDPQEWLAKGDDRKLAQFAQYAMCAAELALADADWKPADETGRLRTGVCVGSGIGSIEDFVTNAVAFQDKGYRRVSPMFVPRSLINMAAGHITMKHGFQGPNHAVSTACTTGAHSLGDAARFIMFGDADVMVAGGSEACVHPLAIAGFARAKSLSTQFNDTPERASRPFDQARDGFVIGEGSGVVVLEEWEHAQRRGAPIYAELCGYGLSADAHHMTAPPDDGRGAQLAMRRALQNAGVDPADVGYVNAHATSTPLGDTAENHAIKTVLKPADPSRLAVSSCKGAIGHLLGAAGAVEAIYTILAVHTGTVPPTLNYTPNPDDTDQFTLNYVPGKAQVLPNLRAALTNSFGFGGTNASLCITKAEV